MNKNKKRAAITQSTSPMTGDGLFDRVASILEQA